MQYYAIIHPVTNKIIEFSEFVKNDMSVAITGLDSEGMYSVNFLNALCIGPIEYDVSLFDKTYNPSTNTFE